MGYKRGRRTDVNQKDLTEVRGQVEALVQMAFIEGQKDILKKLNKYRTSVTTSNGLQGVIDLDRLNRDYKNNK